MARFIFKLEPVLRHRRRVEGEARREMAQLLHRRSKLHDQLRQMQHDLSEDKQRMQQSLTGTVDVDRIRMHGAHHAQVTQRAQGIVRHLATLESQIETARTKLVESSRGRRAIERLRERQHARWKAHVRKREAAAADELATQRYTHARYAGASAAPEGATREGGR